MDKLDFITNIRNRFGDMPDQQARDLSAFIDEMRVQDFMFEKWYKECSRGYDGQTKIPPLKYFLDVYYSLGAKRVDISDRAENMTCREIWAECKRIHDLCRGFDLPSNKDIDFIAKWDDVCSLYTLCLECNLGESFAESYTNEYRMMILRGQEFYFTTAAFGIPGYLKKPGIDDTARSKGITRFSAKKMVDEQKEIDF